MAVRKDTAKRREAVEPPDVDGIEREDHPHERPRLVARRDETARRRARRLGSGRTARVVGLCYATALGGVAQTGRALPSHGRGQGFKSPHLHIIYLRKWEGDRSPGSLCSSRSTVSFYRSSVSLNPVPVDDLGR
jgi:hypothetical protein